MNPPDLSALRALVEALPQESSDLRSRLRWLEQTSAAMEALDLGPRGAEAALQFRAALGAVAAFVKAKAGREQIPALELTLKTFVARGNLAMVRALSEQIRALATASLEEPMLFSLAQRFDALAQAVEAGESPPSEALKELQGLLVRMGQ